MRRLSLFMLLIVLFYVQPALAKTRAIPPRQAAATPLVLISSPVGGQALQGQVEILGTSAVENFLSGSLAFAYHDDPTGTWFLILETDAGVTNGTLAQWDTTTITDGDYDLRLLVTLADGSQVSSFIDGLRVRNYSAVETDTPVPPTHTPTSLPITPGATEADTPTPSPTVTSTASVTPVPPTVTPLPTNPAELSQATLLTTLGKGALVTVALFALLGAYLAVRLIQHRPPKQPKP